MAAARAILDNFIGELPIPWRNVDKGQPDGAVRAPLGRPVKDSWRGRRNGRGRAEPHASMFSIGRALASGASQPAAKCRRSSRQGIVRADCAGGGKGAAIPSSSSAEFARDRKPKSDALVKM